MKRGAERQLTKDDGEEHEDTNDDLSGSMQKADEATLAQRKIRGLPKRVAQNSIPPASINGSDASAPDSKPKFSGFGGFGSSTPSTFTFGSAPTDSKLSAPTTGGLVFSTSPAFSTSFNTPTITSTAPSVSSSASNATKSFASLLSPSSPNLTKSTNGNTSSHSGGDSAAFKYYKSLRGLNVSLLSTISNAVDADPFCDVGDLLEQYKKHRLHVQSEFDSANKTRSTVHEGDSTNTSTSLPPAAPSTSPAPPPTPPISLMPTPPSSFSGFGSSQSISSSSLSGASLPAPGGFTPTFGTSASSKPSLFFSPASSDTGSSIPTSTDKSTEKCIDAPIQTSEPRTGASTSSSGTKSVDDSPDKSEHTGASKSTFGGFDNPFSTARTNTLFGFSKPVDEAESKDGKPTEGAAKSTFAFGASSGSQFGSSSFGVKASSASLFGASPSPLFGTVPVPSLGASATATKNDSDTESKPSLFTFNSLSSAQSKSGSFAGFGGATKTGETSSLGSKTPVGFSFGAGPSNAGSSSAESTPVPEESTSESTVGGQYDREGEGEEDEETTHEIKTKVYKLTKDREGESGWTDMGIGMLRLKKHKANGKRRMFLRNSSTGKIVVNFGIYAGLKPTINKSVIGLMGHDEAGAQVPYRLRVGKVESAVALKDALEREIEFVKASSGST